MNKQEFLKASKNINIKNLKIAREGLLGLDPDLLRMRNYRSVKGIEDGKFYSTSYTEKESCGTFGCAIGWCPFIEGLEPEKFGFDAESIKRNGLAFGIYSQEMFGIQARGILWDYMFASCWQDFDNTVEGLIKRMTHVIEGDYRKIKP